MTSYSMYGTSRLRLVDGGLSTDDETRQEQMEQIVNCVAAGAARALLDHVRDVSDEDADVRAEQWQSAEEGWELHAITDEELPGFLDVVSRFVRENLSDVLFLGEFIAWGRRVRLHDTWHGNSGMGLYRVGYLLGGQGHRAGTGFLDYAYPQTAAVVDRLTAWVDRNTSLDAPGRFWWEDAWVDSAEEPCLLHIHG